MFKTINNNIPNGLVYTIQKVLENPGEIALDKEDFMQLILDNTTINYCCIYNDQLSKPRLILPVKCNDWDQKLSNILVVFLSQSGEYPLNSISDWLNLVLNNESLQRTLIWGVAKDSQLKHKEHKIIIFF